MSGSAVAFPTELVLFAGGVVMVGSPVPGMEVVGEVRVEVELG